MKSNNRSIINSISFVVSADGASAVNKVSHLLNNLCLLRAKTRVINGLQVKVRTIDS